MSRNDQLAAPGLASSRPPLDPVLLRQKAFLEAFAVMGIIRYAAHRAGVHRQTVEHWRKNDPDFARAFKDAKDDANELLEQELHRRAVSGVRTPVYQGGRKIGSVREYSDRLLELTLKARKPEMYRERVDVTAKVKAEADVTPDEMVAALMEHLSADDLARIADAMLSAPQATAAQAPDDEQSGSGSAQG